MLKVKKFWPSMVFAVVAFSGLGVWVAYSEFGMWQPKMSHIHYHAGFQIYQDEELLDFSDISYMYLGSCGDMANGQTIQDRVHLHDQVGDVIHVHAPEISWADMFESLGLQDSVSQVTAMSIDGRVVPLDTIEETIEEYQSAVFVIGTGEITRLDDERVEKKYIREVESATLNCSSP